MTDMIVMKYGSAWRYDVHKSNGTCTSGYSYQPEYASLESILKAYSDFPSDDWEPTKEWEEGYFPVFTIDMLSWEDDQEV